MGDNIKDAIDTVVDYLKLQYDFCAEDDFNAGCVSCQAGAAIRLLVAIKQDIPMTNKQDDIPDDVWKVAQDVAKSLWLTTAKTTHIARAILAERERCAVIAEGRHGIWGTPSQVGGIEVEDDISACSEIAAAIRKGTS